MAGRPVAARGGGGMLYGLIAFVVVAVAGLGGFVWQLTANKRLQSEIDSAKRRLSQYGSPPDYYVKEAEARRGSVFAAMNKDLEELALLVTGKREAVRPAIVEAANALLAEIASTSPGTIEAGDTLLTALRKLHGAYVELSKAQQQLRLDFEELQLARQALEEGVQAVREEYQREVAALKQEAERREQEKAAQLAAKDEQLARQMAETEALMEEVNRLKAEARRRDDEYEITLTKLNNRIRDLEAKMRELRPSGFDPYAILTKADGQVLRAIPGSDVVYIDLGARDRIRPGMTFEVFSPMRARREEFLGKAAIEVTAVMESTAECRVTRSTPGRPIVEGDVVVNIAYERDRLPAFVVRGAFDLDYDGRVDDNGVEKVGAIVRAWGGRVVDQVDENTDFVVLGMGPQVPELPGGRPVSEVIRDLADSRLDELTEYRQVVEQARSLYIPIITQSQFLFLTGYSGQGPVLVD